MRDKNISLIESEVLRILQSASFQIYKDLNFSDLAEEALDDFQILASLPEALRGAGLDDLYNTIQDGYADDLEFIEDILKSQTLPPLTDIDKQTIGVIVEADMNNIAEKFNAYNGDISQVLTRNILTGQAPDFNAIVAKLGSKTARNVITEFDTALSALGTSINIKKAKEVFKNPKFEYFGANDGRTRSFCREHIGKVYTLNQIEKLDNGQGLSVLQYKGGYNCRHDWIPVGNE